MTPKKLRSKPNGGKKPAISAQTRAYSPEELASGTWKVAKPNGKQSAENPEIRRAAERAKLSVTPWPGEPNPGKAMLEALRQAEWPGDHLAILRKHAESYEQAVAELGGAKADPYEAAMRHVTTRFGEQLVMVCDQLGEEIATMAERDGGAGGLEDNANVIDALLTLWRIRWELGLTASQFTVDAKVPDHAVESAVKRAKRAGNGAAEVAS